MDIHFCQVTASVDLQTQKQENLTLQNMPELIL